MKTECKSCKTAYEFPDEKVSAAGTAGLRIRCKKCRAVMVIVLQNDFSGENSAEDTANDLPSLKRRTAGEPEFTDIHGAAPAGPLPAQKDAQGQYQARAGVRREVTGMHLAGADSEQDKKVWYAAIGGESRGPFYKRELLGMAEKGRIRGSTLVWRPGFEEWTRIRARAKNANPELLWLRDVVVRRKRKERFAEAKAKRALGIHTIVLDDGPGNEFLAAEDAEIVIDDDFLLENAPESSAFKENGKVIAAGALWGLVLLMIAVAVSQSL